MHRHSFAFYLFHRPSVKLLRIITSVEQIYKISQQYFDGLVQIASAMELLQSCTKSSICWLPDIRQRKSLDSPLPVSCVNMALLSSHLRGFVSPKRPLRCSVLRAYLQILWMSGLSKSQGTAKWDWGHKLLLRTMGLLQWKKYHFQGWLSAII